MEPETILLTAAAALLVAAWLAAVAVSVRKLLRSTAEERRHPEHPRKEKDGQIARIINAERARMNREVRDSLRQGSRTGTGQGRR